MSSLTTQPSHIKLRWKILITIIFPHFILIHKNIKCTYYFAAIYGLPLSEKPQPCHTQPHHTYTFLIVTEL